MADTTQLNDAIPTGLSDVGNATAALNVLGAFVTATSDLIKKVSDLLPNETRSIVVEIDNDTPHPLTQVGDNFDHGGFGQTLPKLHIDPFSNDVFSVESDGVATGISGSVTYNTEGIGNFLVGFDNPFIGSNAVNASADPAVNAIIEVLGEKSDGNHNHARFAVVDKDSPGGQAGWRACPKCQGMHFAGFTGKGVCPAGGQHDQTGSFNYLMIFGGGTSSKVQAGWRACPKCQGMHFAGFTGKGVCPAGGQHDQTNSFAYVMMFNVELGDLVQVDWAACSKCQGLFFGPFGGVCPAGGAHDRHETFDYGVRFGTS